MEQQSSEGEGATQVSHHTRELQIPPPPAPPIYIYMFLTILLSYKHFDVGLSGLGTGQDNCCKSAEGLLPGPIHSYQKIQNPNQAFGSLEKLDLISPWGAGTGLSRGYCFFRFEKMEAQKKVFTVVLRKVQCLREGPLKC